MTDCKAAELGSIWTDYIKGDSEADIEKEFTSRIVKSFSFLDEKQAKYTLCECVNQHRLQDLSRIDLVVKRDAEVAPIIVEVKKPETLSSSVADHCDQLVTYGLRFFAENPLAGRVVCILTDGNAFYVGRFQRETFAEITYQIHDYRLSLYGTVGTLDQEALETLLRALYVSSLPLTFNYFIEVPQADGRLANCQLALKYYLASGGSSSVYIVSANLLNYAFKKADRDYKDQMKREIEVRKQLQNTSIALPLLGYDERRSYIISAVGCPAQMPPYLPAKIVKILAHHGKFGYGHFVEVLDKVKELHQKGYVHRDLRLDNLILFEREAYLNDFGCTILIEHEPTDYEGSVETGSQRSIDYYVSKKPFRFEPIDDLESVMKCFLLWLGQRPFIFEPGVSRGLQAQHYWKYSMPGLNLPVDYEERFTYIRNHIIGCAENLKCMLIEGRNHNLAN